MHQLGRMRVDEVHIAVGHLISLHIRTMGSEVEAVGITTTEAVDIMREATTTTETSREA